MGQIDDLWRYDGRRAVVTGCGSGIGAEVARQLTELGAEVVGLDLKEPAFAVKEFHEIDLSDPASIDTAVAAIDGPVDVLFNIAGVSSGIGDPLRVVTIDFLGTRHFTEALIPSMPSGSAIASVSSLAASEYRANATVTAGLLDTATMAEGVEWCERNPQPVKDGGGYRLAKEALILYGMANVTTLGAKGIRINCTAPGVTDTPILDQLRSAYGQEFLDSFKTPHRPCRRAGRTGERAGVPQQHAASIHHRSGDLGRRRLGGREGHSGTWPMNGERWNMASWSDFRRVADDVRNWGRWGDADELGTLNLITADKVAQAASLVKHGKVFPLGVDFGSSGPQGAFHFRQNPLHIMTIDGGDASTLAEYGPQMDEEPAARQLSEYWTTGPMRFNDDVIIMPLQAATQWDALSHVYYEDKLYNGFPADSVTSLGAFHCGIDKVDGKGITSRGVLLDIVALRGAETYCELGDPITPAELDEAARAQGVTIGQRRHRVGPDRLVGTVSADRRRHGAGRGPGLDVRVVAARQRGRGRRRR